MKKGKLGPAVPTQSLVLFALCGAGVLGFLLLVILPADRASAELDRDIATLTARVEEQKVLSPVFKNLFEKARSPVRDGAVTPARTKLSRPDIAALPKRFQDMAAAHRLGVREVVPDINTLTDSSGRLSMKINVQGQFADLRGFLLDVGALPFFDGIEELDIRGVEGGGEEVTLKVWLARE
jgi:hypothetical protein